MDNNDDQNLQQTPEDGNVEDHQPNQTTDGMD